MIPGYSLSDRKQTKMLENEERRESGFSKCSGSNGSLDSFLCLNKDEPIVEVNFLVS